jgi:hypothetical protein
VLTGAAAGAHGGGDPPGDGIGLVRAGVERQHLHRSRLRHRAGERRAGHEALVQPLSRFQALGVVVPDQAVCRVQDRLAAAKVVVQDHPRAAREGGAESKDVRQRCPAEAIDALVIVADHGDIGAWRPGQ